MKSLVFFSALAATSAIAGAQVKTANPDSTCTKYSDGRIQCRVYRRGSADSLFRRMTYRMDSVMENRAALGLEVRATGSKRDTLGVFVESVTPKGPAENAGIVEGDRIASINGVDLRTAAVDIDDDEYVDRGLGARRLTREVQKLTPGARVTLRINSGGRVRDVQVTTGKASEVLRLGRRFGFAPGGGFEFFGPGEMMSAPQMQMLRERMPMLRQDMEPMLRGNLEPMLRENLEPMLERLRDLPEKIQLRTLPTIRTLRIQPRTYRVDSGTEELPDLIDLDDDAEVLSPEAVRDLAATAVRDARAALRQLSAAGIV
jgi:hypothetical protein